MVGERFIQLILGDTYTYMHVYLCGDFEILETLYACTCNGYLQCQLVQLIVSIEFQC